MDSAEETETIKSSPKMFRFCINQVPVSGIVVLVFVFVYSRFPTISYLLIGLLQVLSYVINNIFIVFLSVIALIGVIILLHQYYSQTKTAEEKLDLHDQYVSARTPSPEYNYRVTEVEDDYNHNNNNNNSSYYKEIAPASFQAVNEYNCYERQAVMEDTRSYRRTRSEEKSMRMMEYQRTESERVSKTASWRSESMDGLSSEEFRTTVETFTTEKKKMLLFQSGGVDQWHNGGVDQWHNGGFDHRLNGGAQWQNNVPQLQNGGVQWQNNVPQLQNGVVQWLNGVPQLQNGAADQWENNVPRLQNGAIVQWQGSPKDGSSRRHRHRSRSKRST